MSTVLQVKDLCKTYITNKRQNNVLKNVSFSIDEGEMVAIMGPSGSGKSTLLYSVSGMDKPTAGEVTLGDKNIATLNDNELSEVRLKYMGFIFQQMHMLKNLSVIDNILLPAYKLTNDKAKRKEIDEYCNELMQRACICRSMINNPKILFADEPTGALNKSASDDVMKQLTKINEEGTSIMLVTHDMKVAAKCTRILYIVDGNIKGEINLGKLVDDEIKERQRKVSNWLYEMGW